MRVAFLGLALLGSCSASEQNLPWSKCGEDKLGIEELSVSEYPIKAGDEVTLKVVFKPTTTITGGDLDLTLKLQGMEIFEQSFDLCRDLVGLKCPLPAGKEVVAVTTNTIPPGMPKLTLVAHIVARDEAGKSLSCLDATLRIVNAYRDEDPFVDTTMIAHLNMAQTLWTAKVPQRFLNATMRDVAKLCGTWTEGHPAYMKLPPKEEGAYSYQKDDIPESFDAREHWAECKDIIGHVRDQSSCGSCWAFATTEALNDRMCIKKKLSSTLLSPTDTAACCSGMACGFSNGCNGGQPAGAWRWFTYAGVVSGGDFGDVGQGDTCLPYPFETCAHHVEPDAEHPPCPAEDYATPVCAKTCTENSYNIPYHDDKRKAVEAYSVPGVEKIQLEIMENGPVTAAFTVYSDFPTYESGVYKHVGGTPLGGHAVKIIGWGVEEGTPYWLVVNSWNSGWGDQGLFKILRGSNECGIESQITAGTV